MMIILVLHISIMMIVVILIIAITTMINCSSFRMPR